MSPSGSTAPVITSTLEAWPARPSPRSSISPRKPTSLEATSSRPFPTSTAPSRKGKEVDTGNNASSDAYKAVQTPPPIRLRKHTMDEGDFVGGSGAAVRTGSSTSGKSSTYPPPRKPLTPNQLGRIAQSFGIVIPSLPQPPTHLSPSMHASSSRSPHTITSTSSRTSPFLLTVIPPFSLLPNPSAESTSRARGGSSSSHADSNGEVDRATLLKHREKRRKWKRGKLMSLQPTMGSMLLSIAREYGLPSTQGVNLYLVTRQQPNTIASQSQSQSASNGRPGSGHDRSRSMSSNGSFSSIEYEEAAGPQISAGTWSTLFSSYTLTSAAPSRATTPVHTPGKSYGALGRNIAYPPSPISSTAVDRSVSSSAVERAAADASASKQQRQRMASFPSQRRPSVSKEGDSSFGSIPSSDDVRTLGSSLPGHSEESMTTLNSTLPPTPKSHRPEDSNHPYTYPAFSPNAMGSFNPIVGTIEFEIDTDLALWFEDWQKNRRGRHTRQISSHSDSGLTSRSASRLQHHHYQYPNAMLSPYSEHAAFNRDLNNSLNESTGGGMRTLRLVKKVNQDQSSPNYHLRSRRPSKANSLRDVDQKIPLSTKMRDLPPGWMDSPPLPQKSNSSQHISNRHKPGDTARNYSDEDRTMGSEDVDRAIQNVVDLLNRPEVKVDDLLASPIELEQEQLLKIDHPAPSQNKRSINDTDSRGHLRASSGQGMSREEKVKSLVEIVAGEIEKRGSGLLMSDELDRLEQLMHSLSPREIRITSPRVLTPRITAKLAAARLQAESITTEKPRNGGPRLPPSPLASAYTADDGSKPDSAPLNLSDQNIRARSTSDRKLSPDPSAAVPSWPAIPYTASPDSPKIDEYFTRRKPLQANDKYVPSPRSAETLQRSRNGSDQPTDTNWRPQRPQRSPPSEANASPRFESQASIQYSLPSEYAKRVSTTPQEQGQGHQSKASMGGSGGRKFTPSNGRFGGRGRAEEIVESPQSDFSPKESHKRSGSMSLKALKGLSGKGMSIRWGEKRSSSPKIPGSSQLDQQDQRDQPMGLFPDMTTGATSSFASLQQHPSTEHSASEGGMTHKTPPGFNTDDVDAPLPLPQRITGLTGSPDAYGPGEIPSPPTHTFASQSRETQVSTARENQGETASTTASSAHSQGGFTSRILGHGFSFGKKPSLSAIRANVFPSSRSVSPPEFTILTGPDSGDVVEEATSPRLSPKLFGMTREREKKRNFSIDAKTISSPLPETFRQMDSATPISPLLVPLQSMDDSAVITPPSNLVNRSPHKRSVSTTSAPARSPYTSRSFSQAYNPHSPSSSVGTGTGIGLGGIGLGTINSPRPHIRSQSTHVTRTRLLSNEKSHMNSMGMVGGGMSPPVPYLDRALETGSVGSPKSPVSQPGTGSGSGSGTAGTRSSMSIGTGGGRHGRSLSIKRKPVPSPPPTLSALISEISEDMSITSKHSSSRNGMPEAAVIIEKDPNSIASAGAGGYGARGNYKDNQEVMNRFGGKAAAAGGIGMGMTASDSFMSSQSFVLDDPPKRRLR